MLGIVVAVAAQGGLYLGLHQISTVVMPAWAHRPARSGPLPWPSVVPVAVVKGEEPSATGPAAWPVPSLSPPPPVMLLPPPVLRLAPPG